MIGSLLVGFLLFIIPISLLIIGIIFLIVGLVAKEKKVGCIVAGGIYIGISIFVAIICFVFGVFTSAALFVKYLPNQL